MCILQTRFHVMAGDLHCCFVRFDDAWHRGRSNSSTEIGDVGTEICIESTGAYIVRITTEICNETFISSRCPNAEAFATAPAFAGVL